MLLALIFLAFVASINSRIPCTESDYKKQIETDSPCVCCVQKCCPPGLVYRIYDDHGRKDCAAADNETTLEDYFNSRDVRPFDHSYGFPDCEYFFEITQDEFKVESDGTVTVVAGGKSAEPGEYCLDFTYESAAGKGGRIRAWRCFPGKEDGAKPLVRDIITVGMGLSLLFYGLTALALILLRYMLKEVRGKCLLAQVLWGMIAFAALLYVNIFPDMELGECVGASFLVQFSFLSNFFWLNVMCFDLWWNFKGFRFFNGSTPERDTKKFLAYSIYACGFPIVITLVTAMMEFCPIVRGALPNVPKPNFGYEKCFFEDNGWGIFIYFYGPISILLAINVYMFISTAIVIVARERNSEALNRAGSKCHNERQRQRYFVYLKLFIVMGVNWTMEVISWAVGGPDHVWYFPDLFNTLQGVFIFVIFVCKKRNFVLLNQKLCPNRAFFGQGAKTVATSNSTVTNGSVDDNFTI